MLCLIVAFAARFVAEHYGGPPLLIAMLFGMALHDLSESKKWLPGIAFASGPVLRLGVALLGARITAEQIIGLGWQPIAIVAVCIAATFTVGIACARAFGLPRTFGVLTGGSVAICGASAALAVSAVLPADPDKERRTLLTVAVVTALSTAAMVIYPLLTKWLQLDAQTAGIFLGATIHDVAQVVGAATLLSPQAAESATIVKLLRVSFLVPVVFILTMVYRQGGAKNSGQPRRLPGLPLFLWGFVALVGLNSAHLLAPVVTQAMTGLSAWCLVVAIVAIGLRTSFQHLLDLGWKPVAMIVAETVFLAGLALALI